MARQQRRENSKAKAHTGKKKAQNTRPQQAARAKDQFTTTREEAAPGSKSEQEDLSKTSSRPQKRIILRFSPEVNAAIISGLFAILVVVLGAIESRYKFIDSLIRPYQIRSYNVLADEEFSGSGYKDVPVFSSFKTKYHDIGIGDVVVSDSNPITDSQSMFYMTFNLDEMPDFTEIDEVEIVIPCAISGEPSSFSDLRMKSFPYGIYDYDNLDVYFWDQSPYRYYDVAWKETAFAIDDCQAEQQVTIEGNNIRNAFEANMTTARSIQYILWFSQISKISNTTTDAILITSPPILRIKYLPR